MKKEAFAALCIVYIIVGGLYVDIACAQQKTSKQTTYSKGLYRMAFYNVENFFDPIHDSTKNDIEFTPTGSRHWTWRRFEQKSYMLFKVIAALDAQCPLLFIGLAEVESDRALNQLCYGTPLRYNNYKYIHFPTADPRGIGVALLYRADRVNILGSHPIEMRNSENGVSKTRHILYVQMKIKETEDTIHAFVVHFPSKYGGAAATETKRYIAGKRLKASMDTIQKLYPGSKIIALGDFNAELSEKTLLKSISYKTIKDTIKDGDYINLMSAFTDGQGSNKFRETWSLIDQIIINSTWSKKVETIPKAQICREEYLLVQDLTYFGMKLFRSYTGFKYTGGYSDHLPVYMDYNFRAEPP